MRGVSGRCPAAESNHFHKVQGGELSADPRISADFFHEFRAIFIFPRKIIKGDNFRLSPLIIFFN